MANNHKSFVQRWRELSITTKFSSAFGLLLILILLVSITSYFALTVVRRRTEASILTSTEIQRLVLKMDAGLQVARRLEREFFLRYPTIGLDKARQMYVQRTREQIEEVIALSAQLRQLIATPDVSTALQKSNVNLNLYLSASRYYAGTFEEAVNLVDRLAAPETGLEAQLTQTSSLLREILDTSSNSGLMLLYHEMQAFEKEYLLRRQRPLMQSAFNIVFLLRQAIETTSALEANQKAQAHAYLKEYLAIAEEILQIDSAIRSKFNEFDLQAEALDPISADLVALASAEVKRARTQIEQTNWLVTVILLAVALLGVGLTVITAIILNHDITRNVMRLTQVAGELQAGNLNVTVQIESADEIGQLAENFNTMAARIHTLVENLEQKVAERTEKLAAARDQAEAANRAKSEFLSNMSHELRTPMNAILGFAQLMQRDPALNATQRENIGTIVRSGEHLLKLINDVLDMSKIEAGQITLNLQSFDLYQTLTSIEEMMRVRAEKKGLQLTVTRTSDVPRYIKTDESKLRQVLVNLLSNAVKFTEEGSITLNIENCQLNIENWGGEKGNLQSSIVNLQFSISDTGIGITPEEKEILFDPFIQTRRTGVTTEGTGLGLAISRKFVQLMGGDIRIESEVGKGSVFSFDIQVESADAAEIKVEQPERRVIRLEHNQPGYRILVVEDNLENRVFLTQLLRSIGFEVREATNGQEAIEQYDHCQPHLILMDMRMPVMDGYEATRRIREHATRNSQLVTRIPIIALTASAFEEDRAQILSAGCDDVVKKPVRETELFETIHKHLGVRYVYEESHKSNVESRKSTVEGVLTPEALAALPPDVLTNLERATGRSDMQLIISIIEEIRVYDSALADALVYLADKFDYDEILRLIEQAKGSV